MDDYGDGDSIPETPGNLMIQLRDVIDSYESLSPGQITRVLEELMLEISEQDTEED